MKVSEAEDINKMKGKRGVREWELTVIRNGRQNLGLDVLQGETHSGASNYTLRYDGLCKKEMYGMESGGSSYPSESAVSSPSLPQIN